MEGCLYRMLSNRLLLKKPFVTYSRILRTLKTAVIGSGPAGFYLAQYLIKNCPDARVDIYEKYPVPFGLVRFGVAPDHPEVKNVINSFTTTGESDRVKFFGNISIGSDLTLSELRDAYDAVVLCYGSSKDRPLNVPGEWETPNVVSARSFVGWYNGVPADRDLNIDLNVESAVIIGQGNVALDVARILLTPVTPVLRKTDITSHAVHMLEKTRIKNVFIVGRRGPLQVAFTIKELREMTKIDNCRTIIDPVDVSFITAEKIEQLPRARRRLTQLMVDISKGMKDQPDAEKSCHFQFLKSPIEIKTIDGFTNSDDQLEVTFARNELSDPLDTKSKCTSLPNAEMETLNCGLILKSIGYMTIALDPSLPMNERKGCIENVGGRVSGHSGLYCSGWSATGPSGVLVNTMNVSFEVGRNILDDAKSGIIGIKGSSGDTITQLLNSRNVQVVTFDDWKNIDKMEQKAGELSGKPREKLTLIEDMVSAAKSDK